MVFMNKLRVSEIFSSLLLLCESYIHTKSLRTNIFVSHTALHIHRLICLTNL